MTDEQIALAKHLARCSLPVATNQKSFIVSMANLAENAPYTDLTEKQDRFLRDMAFRFRRQLPAPLLFKSVPQQAYNTLQWMAPELVRDGLIKNETWIPEHCERAVEIFSEQKLQIGAVLFCAMHPRAIEYITQAPILVLAATRGKNPSIKANRYSMASEFMALCRNPIKLKHQIEFFKFAPQLRGLSGKALSIDNYQALKALRNINPSTLAQSIPRGQTEQIHWVTCLDHWCMRMASRFNDGKRLLDWAVKNLTHADVSSVGDLADFAGARVETFNERWSYERAMTQCARWHTELARASEEEKFKLSYGVGWDEPVDYGPLPVALTIDGLEFIALQSGLALFEEGRTMHHCVASYARSVINGRSRIYSIRRSGERIATFEIMPSRVARLRTGEILGDRWGLAQLKGLQNSKPPQRIWDAVKKFIDAITDPATRIGVTEILELAE